MNIRPVESPGPRSTGARLREVVRLAAPASASMLSYTVVSLVDTMMVGHLGAAPLAGVGLANTILFTAGAFLFGLMQAVTPLAAQADGAGRHRKKHAVRRAALLGWLRLHITGQRL